MAIYVMKFLRLLFFILPSSWALAQNPGDVFVGLTYNQARVKDTSTRNWGTFEPASLSVGVGVIALPNLALEAFVLDGTHHASNTIAPRTTATVQILSGYGFAVRPFVQLGHGWSAYIKLGRQYGAQDVVTSGPTVQLTTHTTYAHTNYGVGTSYNLNARWSVALEHGRARSIPGENTRTSATGLGLRYMF
jgi:hypothetical protein